MSFGELIFIFFLALMVFGPRRLPEIARTVGRLMAELRRAGNEFRYSLEEEVRELERQEVARKPALPAPPGSVAQPAAPAAAASAAAEAATGAGAAGTPERP